MVRTYKRKVGSRKYQDYSEETLELAVSRYEPGNLVALSEEYNIPYATLYRKIKGLHTKKAGGQTLLSSDEEKKLVKVICISAEWGFPCDTDDIKDLVQNYLEKCGKVITQFTNNRPGETWMQKFLCRHKESLSKRLSQSIKESRAQINHQTINKYFDNLSEALKDVHPEAIVNYDETNFTDDPGRVKVVVRKSCKRAERIMDTSKAATSVMFACTASGLLLPVYIVYKSDHLWSTWTEGGPAGARFNRSRSGWFDGNIFEDWFTRIIIPYFKSLPEGPRVLIGDNLASHLSMGVIQKCEENNIRFLLLPPNSTHMTQPLDVCVFRPIKNCWRQILRDWKRHNKGVVRKDVFPRLLNKALQKLEPRNEDNIKSGFVATGIMPIDRNKILDKLPKTKQEDTEETDHMVQSFQEMFEKARYKSPNQTLGRKRKLTVEAGKSISASDLVPRDTSSTSNLGNSQKTKILDVQVTTTSGKKKGQKLKRAKKKNCMMTRLPIAAKTWKL